VKLVSLVGDVAALAARACAAGEVASSPVPALNASHLTTAPAVRVSGNGGGGMPTPAADLSRAIATGVGGEMLGLATLACLAAGKGVALPVGVSDTRWRRCKTAPC